MVLRRRSDRLRFTQFSMGGEHLSVESSASRAIDWESPREIDLEEREETWRGGQEGE